MKIDEIKKAYREGKHVSAAQAGEAIGKDAEMFFSFLMDNNPIAVHKILKLKFGYKLPFSPDRAAMGGIINSLLAKGDTATLQKLVNEFVIEGFNPNPGNYTADKELLIEILKHINTNGR